MYDILLFALIYCDCFQMTLNFYRYILNEYSLNYFPNYCKMLEGFVIALTHSKREQFCFGHIYEMDIL